MTQEEYNQNRFKYLDEYDDMKIMTELEETKSEIARCEDEIYNGEVKHLPTLERDNDEPYKGRKEPFSWRWFELIQGGRRSGRTCGG